MSRLIPPFFIIVLLVPALSAQNKLDSLASTLVSASGTDSVDILNNLGLNYAYSDIAKAKYYSEEALKVSKKMNYGIGEVAALINVGYSHLDHQRVDSSIYYFKLAISKASEIDYDRGIGNANNALGNIYRENGDNSLAIKYYKEALVIQEKVNNQGGISSALNNLGRALNQLAVYSEATEYLLRALKINQENGWNRKAALNLLGLSQIKVDQQEEELALKYLNQLVQMEEIKDDLYLQTSIYNQLGFVYSELGDFAQSESAFEKCLQLYEDYNKLPSVPTHNYANMKLDEGFPKEAEKLALRALEYKRQDRSILSQSFTYNLLSDIYLKMGRTEKALEVSEKALAIVLDKKAKSRERKTYLDLSEIHQKRGNYKLALSYRLKYETLQDSLFTAQKAGQQRAMLALFESEKQQQQIASQQMTLEAQEAKQKQQETQLLFLIIGVIITVLFAGTILWSYLNIKKIKAKVEDQNQQLTQLNQTKDKFFGIIAHDIRSPLIGLQGVGSQVNFFLKKGKTEKLESIAQSIGDTSKKLTELLDNLLNWALLQNGMIPYQPTKLNINESVRSVFDLLKPLAEMKEVELLNESKEDLSIYADQKAVNTILRNLISNALKYTDAGGKVSVSFEDKGNTTSILINDTGTGISAEQLPRIFELDKESKEGTRGEKGSGLGLVLCKELVELNNGSINVKSKSGIGTTFSFDLPKHEEAA